MNKVLKGIVSGIAGAALLVSCTDCPPQNPQNYTGFIHKDTANKMIQSYLKSLDNIPPPEEGVSPQQLYSLLATIAGLLVAGRSFSRRNFYLGRENSVRLYATALTGEALAVIALRNSKKIWKQ